MVEGNEDDKDTETYRLAVVTNDFVYYAHDDADELSGTVMLTLDLQFVSDNYFANEDLTNVIIENKGIAWMSKNVRYWQRTYVDLNDKSPEIKKALSKVNVSLLNDQEKVIYLAFLNSGPVKYTKRESLMGVISNQLDCYTQELASIIKLLEDSIT